VAEEVVGEAVEDDGEEVREIAKQGKMAQLAAI
jgi:hypothetical protein